MTSVDRLLREIEAEFQRDPYKVWEYLEEDDLLLTKSMNNRFIIGVRRYIPERRMIAVKFIYSLNTDTFYRDSGLESPDMVERYPYNGEIEKLEKNLDYLTFISNQ